MENNEMKVTREARRLLSDAFMAEGLDRMALWIRDGGADKSTHTPALRAITTALAAKEAENVELRAKVERLREALAEQVDECFDERCEMCLRHEALLAETQPDERTDNG